MEYRREEPSLAKEDTAPALLLMLVKRTTCRRGVAEGGVGMGVAWEVTRERARRASARRAMVQECTVRVRGRRWNDEQVWTGQVREVVEKWWGQRRCAVVVECKVAVLLWRRVALQRSSS